MSSATIRTAVFALLFMGSVLVYVPYLLTSGGATSGWSLGAWRYLGLLPLGAGITGIGASYDRYRATVPRWIPRRPAALCIVLGLGALGASPLRAQAVAPAGPPQPLPQGQLFAPLIADPKQPHFYAAWLWVTSPLLTSQVASVGLGEDIGLVRGPRSHWQLSVAAGVFSQFNEETPSNDLINTDFVIGFPVTYRGTAFSARARLYHQSSHLGDEFILHNNPTRINLSFEALELLGAFDFGGFRAYGGGEYLVRYEPSDLKPGLLHAGLEYRMPGRIVRFGRLGDGRLIAALDAKSSQERAWQTGWSVRAGIEFQPSSTAMETRQLSVQLQAYDGPAPYGQFYLDNVKSVGLGLHFSL